MGPLFFPLALLTVRRIKASSVLFGQASSICRMVYLEEAFHIFPCCNRQSPLYTDMLLSSLPKKNQSSENVLPSPLLEQDSGESSGTLPIPPHHPWLLKKSLSSKFLLPQDHNCQKGCLELSGRAPCSKQGQLPSVHQHLLQSGVDRLQGWRSHTSTGSLASVCYLIVLPGQSLLKKN